MRYCVVEGKENECPWCFGEGSRKGNEDTRSWVVKETETLITSVDALNGNYTILIIPRCA